MSTAKLDKEIERSSPGIADPEADRNFRNIAAELSLDPDNPWVGGYVEYEWRHARYFLEARFGDLRGMSVLEFGCNYGATSIVLAALGANVAGIDVNGECIRLAEANARRYGFSDQISFTHVRDTAQLPFGDGCFDLVMCNSVLEYVPHKVLPRIQMEINRVLNPGGYVFVLGTSSRLWPREVHSRRWLVNYLPRAIDSIVFGGKKQERGVFPWRITRGFGAYENCDASDCGRSYLKAKADGGGRGYTHRLMAFCGRILAPMGISVGILTPSICVLLRKGAR